MSTIDRRSLVALSAASLLHARLGRAATTGAPPPSKEVKTAGIRLITVDGKYKVWTKKLGAGKIKVLTLHGGPGVTHEYFECFEDFLPQAGVEFYYYDQLGSFYSDQPDDKSLWTIDRFREEVEQVRAALGLEDFFLYGQSWGSMLAIEYALKYQKHLKGLVLSSMTASIASYVEYVNKLRAALPPEVLAVLVKYEEKGDYENPEYQAVMFKEVYGRHVCRLDPWPDPVARAFKHISAAGLQHDAGPERVRRDRDVQGLGPLEGPLEDHRAHARHRRPVRRDESRRHPEDGQAPAELAGRDLRERQPPGDVGRSGGVLRGPDRLSQGRRRRPVPETLAGTPASKGA